MKNNYTNRFRWLVTSVTLSLILLLSSIQLRAQVAVATFVDTVLTYTPITGGTVLSASCTDDDNNYALQPIGFTFGWNGGSFTQVGVSANGYLSLGGLTTTSYSPLTVLHNVGNIVCAYGRDLQGKAAPCGETRIQTIGTAPNRTCVVQWSNLARYQSVNNPTDTFNFQIRINETGIIDIVYGYFAIASADAPQVGILGTALTDFSTRTGTFNASSTAGTANNVTMPVTATNKPALGLTYTWSFPPQTYSSSTVSNAPGNSVLRGGTNQAVVRVEVTTAGSSSPLVLTQLNLNTTGSTSLSHITAAKVFFTGNSSSYSTTTQFGTTVTAPSAAYSVSGTQALQTGVNYFWVVYDISPTATLGAVVDAECTGFTLGGTPYVPTITAPAGNKLIAGPLSGLYTVGSSGTYATLTEAIAELNARGASGAVTLSLLNDGYNVGSGESFPLTISAYSGMSPTNRLTIRPASGVSPIITDSNATAIFIIDGAKYVTIQGVNSVPSTVRGMTIQNRSTAATATTITIRNDATSTSITNTFLRGANNSNSQTFPSYGTLFVGGTTNVLGNGNDSIVIKNNTFARAAVLNDTNLVMPAYSKAITFDGQSAVQQNDNAIIDSNNMYGFSQFGINITSNNSGNAGGFRIRGNNIFDTAITIAGVTTNYSPIYFNAGNVNSTNNTISGNFIGGTSVNAGGSAQGQPKQLVDFAASGWNYYGIFVNASQISPSFVTNNTIRNINLFQPSALVYFNGVYLSQGAIDLLNNTIGNPADTASITVRANGWCGMFYGVQSYAGGLLNIKNNIISAIDMPSTASNGGVGFYISSNNSAVCNIDSNTISRIWTRSVSTSGGGSTCQAFIGIYSGNASPNVSIRWNTIGGTNLADSISLLNATGGKFSGIYAISGIQNVSNNRIQNIYAMSNSAGATTSASLLGIYLGSGTNGQLINNNIVRDFRSYTYSGLSAVGIMSGSGAATLNGNNVTNFNIASNVNGTLTSAAINGIILTSGNFHTTTNNTVSNLTLLGHPTNGVGQINGIFSQVSNQNTVSNNTVANLFFNGPGAGSINGIYNNSAGINQIFDDNDVFNLVSNDTSNNSQTLRGIYFQASTQLVGNTSRLTRNFVSGLNLAAPTTSLPAASVLYGMQVLSSTATVANNQVNVGRDTSGIPQTRAMDLKGLRIENTAGQLRVYHNTINVNSAPNFGTVNTGGVEITATPTASAFAFNDLRNNIIVNNGATTSPATGNHYNVMMPTQLFSVFNGANIYTITSNSNLYFNSLSPNSFVGRFNATNYLDLNALRTAAGTLSNLYLQDGGSGFANPNFTNVTGTTASVNLNVASPTPIEGNGDTTIASFVTNDFNGATRSGNPDVGATNGTFTTSTDVFGPAIYPNQVLNTSSPANRTVRAVVFDNGLVPTAANAPRIYFQKRPVIGVNTAWFSAPGVFVSGTTRNRTFDFTIDQVTSLGGLSVGDSVFYYIVAQDSAAANLNSNAPYALGTSVTAITTPPVNPGFYRLTNPLPSTIFIGTGVGTPSFPTLTGPGGAFEAINNNVLTANTTILVQAAVTTEDGTNALNPWFESGAGGYTVTIRPTDNNQYVLAGTTTNAQGLFRLNGVSRLNMFGYSSTGTLNDTNLVLRFNGTSTAIPTLAFVNGGSLDTFSNVIFEGRNTGTGSAAGLVNINATTTTVGLSNVLFRNSHFRTELTATTLHAIGLFAQGTTPRFNSNITVNNCQFYNFTNNGVNFTNGNANGLTVTNNSFYYNFAPTYTGTATMQAISVLPGSTSDNNVVSNNWIGGSTPLAGGTPWNFAGTMSFTGISLSTGITSGTTVNRNVIQNILFSANGNTNQATAINVAGTAAVYAVTNNRIGSLTAGITSFANHRIVGIASTTTGNLTITGDSIINMTTLPTGTPTIAGLTGIQVTSGSSNITNISNNFISNLITNSQNTGTTTAAALIGINMQSTSLSQTISNNRIQTLVNQAAASHSIRGILVTSGSNVMNGNTVYGINSRSTNASTTTLAAVIAIMNSSGVTGAQTMVGNLIDSVWLTTTTTTNAQVIGLCAFNTFGALTLSDNDVLNLNTQSNVTGTANAAGLIGILANTPSAVNSAINGNYVAVLNHNVIAASSAFHMYGIFISTSTGLVGNNTTVNGNFVHSMRSSAPSASSTLTMMGIVNTQGFATYSNNMVRLGIDSAGTVNTKARTMRGIWHQSATQANYYHNTVLIAGAIDSLALNTSAFESQTQITAGQTLDVRNNIFSNQVSSVTSTGRNYGVRYQDSLRINSNYNIIHTPGLNGTAGGIILTNANYTTLGFAMPSWKGTVGLDMASASADPNFDPIAYGTANVAALDLNNNNPAERSGDPTVLGVTTDYYGATRSTINPVDVGADAGNFNQLPDAFPPQISFTALPNAGSISGTRAFNGVVITDNNGIPTSGANVPRVYYSKDGATWYSTGAVTVTGTATNAVANFLIDYNVITPALTATDTIRYYVAAQDNAGNLNSTAPYAVGTNVNTITTQPSNPNRYNFLPVIPANTVIPVGTGQTYTSLTGTGGLFDFLNNSTLGGNVTAEITSDLSENGTVGLRQLAQDGPGAGSFNLTIRPNAATTVARVIEGNVSGNGMIALYGADRVKIQGIPTGGNNTQRMLLFRNTTTSSTPVILVSSAIGVLMNNIIVESGNSNATAGGAIEFKAGVNNILLNTPSAFDTVNNCIIRNNTTAAVGTGISFTGIYSAGLANVYNNNIVISNNQISNMLSFGVLITSNNGDGFRITDNSVFYNLPVYTVTTGFQQGIVCNPTTFSNNNTITGNFIGGSAPNCGGTPWTNNQTVGFTGIRVNVGNNATTNVQNNTIQNIVFSNQTGFNQFIGIFGQAGTLNISNNQVGHPTQIDNIQFGQQTTHYGIIYQGQNAITMNNNTVQGMLINAPALSASLIAMAITNGTVLGFNNNLVGSTTVANSIVHNATSTLIGMQLSLSAQYSPTYTVSNNTVANISALGTQPSITVQGMQFGSSGTPTVTNNTIRNISTNATNLTTVGQVIGMQIGLGSGTVGVFNNNTISAIRSTNVSSAATISAGVVMASGQSTLFNGNRIFDITNASTSTSSLTPVPVAAGIMVTGVNVNSFIQNNQITLGNGQTNPVQYNGIWVQTSNSGVTVNAFNNSLVIDGASSGGAQNSYAILRGNNSGTEMGTWLNLRNNLFVNRRTGGTGNHYAIGNQTTSPTNNTWNNASSNYNLFAASNNNAVAEWGVSAQTIANWRNLSLSDNLTYAVQTGTGAGQLNAANLFTNLTTGVLSLQTANQEVWYAYGKGITGSAINNVATDYNGTARSTAQGTATTLGSVHMTSAPSTLPYAATASAAPAANTTTTYTFANRTIATLAWGTSAPTAATMYDYTGVTATSAPAGNAINRFVRTDISGGTAPYNVGITLNYDAANLGAVSNANNLRIASATSFATPVWTTQTTTTVNTSALTATVGGLSLTGGNIMITGTELNAAPAIRYTTPTARAVSQTVTIVGSLFTGASALSFNGTPQTTYTVVNDTTITTTVPVGATTGPISVTNAFGTTLSSFNFTVIQAPTVTSFTPAAGTIGTLITVTGTNFSSASLVQVGSTTTAFTIVNPTTITFSIPVGATTNPINILNPAGTVSSSTSLTVYPAPGVTSFTPTAGPVGTTVTITGTNFNSVTAVNFGGVAASYTVNSVTSITATVPASASTGVVTVVNGTGTGTGGSFTVQLLPTVTSFSPSAGGAGTTVTITGTNFTGATAVTLNAVAVSSFVVVNSTTITAVVSGTNTSGTFSVTTPSGSAPSAGSFTVYTNLTVSTNAAVTGGPYSKIFVTSTGTATLAATVQVFDSVIVNNGGVIDFNGNNLTGTGTFTALAGSTVRVSSPTGLSLSGIAGNIQMSGARVFSASANYTYNGTASQVTGNGLPSSVNKLRILNTTGVTLTNPVTVNDTLTMAGSLTLAANNLTIAPAGAITGTTGAVYIVTNGSGKLRRTVSNNATDVLFPVGNAQYSPARVQLTGASTADVFEVRSMTGVMTAGATGSPITTQVVNRTWDITESVVGGSTATVNLAWDDSVETAGFNRALCAVSYYTGAGWRFATPTASYGPAVFAAGQWTRVRTGITTLGFFSVGDGASALPVKLVQFAATKSGNDAVLNWATAQEVDNKGFDIQRSVDGENFETIDFVKGNGTVSQLSRYNYTDAGAQALSGVVYYRLKQVDMDETFTLSNIVSVDFSSTTVDGLVAMPNPFTSAVNMLITSAKETESTVTVTDIQGRVLSTFAQTLSIGENLVAIPNADELNAGIYFINTTIDGVVYKTKIVKAGK